MGASSSSVAIRSGSSLTATVPLVDATTARGTFFAMQASSTFFVPSTWIRWSSSASSARRETLPAQWKTPSHPAAALLDARLVEDVAANGDDVGVAGGSGRGAPDEGDHVMPVRPQRGDEMAAEKARGSGDEIATHACIRSRDPTACQDLRRGRVRELGHTPTRSHDACGDRTGAPERPGVES